MLSPLPPHPLAIEHTATIANPCNSLCESRLLGYEDAYEDAPAAAGAGRGEVDLAMFSDDDEEDSEEPGGAALASVTRPGGVFGIATDTRDDLSDLSHDDESAHELTLDSPGAFSIS